MDHGAITQNREVKGIAVEGHELRRQLGDLLTECADHLFFGALTNVGCT
jgi:hypothetical protein